MANIRDQCSWVHMHEPEEATEKAKDLVRMVVAKAYLLEPLKRMPLEVNKSALVVGGGLSGMTAALEIAEQGYMVHLVERAPDLGGNLRKVKYILDAKSQDHFFDTQNKLDEIIERVQKNDKIIVHTNSEIKSIGGFVGNFVSVIEDNGQEEEIKHGAVVIATGANEFKPDEYLYGQDDRVITQLELEEMLAGEAGGSDLSPQTSDLTNIQNIVMIQCVGSRNEDRPYCSRVCCTNAIKNALKLKQLNPNVNIYILYRDIRTYGFREEFYRKSSEAGGVFFIRYEEDQLPELVKDGKKLLLKLTDPVLEDKLTLNPDLVVLSTAIIPNEDNEELAKMLKVPMSKDKFFLEAHMKLRPVDFASDGMFMAGMGHGPKPIDESISQAAAAVSRACTVISKDRMQVGGVVAKVEADKCAACLICVRACPYDVPTIHEDGYSTIDPSRCQGCGICVAECPNKAIELKHYTDHQILEKSRALTLQAAGLRTEPKMEDSSDKGEQKDG